MLLSIFAALTLGAGPFFLDQDKRGCAATALAQDEPAWCQDIATPSAEPVTLDIVREYEAQARALMTYKKKTSGFSSHYQEVAAGKRWKGNCSDLVVTILDALHRGGYDISRTYRVAVDSDGDRQVDHLVGMVELEGRFYVFGDVFEKAPYMYGQGVGKWTPIMAARNNGKLWYFFASDDVKRYAFAK